MTYALVLFIWTLVWLDLLVVCVFAGLFWILSVVWFDCQLGLAVVGVF